MKHWARDYDECTTCGSTDRKHLARGLCTTCYYQQYKRKPAVRAEPVVKEIGLNLREFFRKAQLPHVVQIRDGELEILLRGKLFITLWKDGA